MIDITSISAVLAAVGVIVGVVLAYLEVRNLVKGRQAELFMNLYSRYYDTEFVNNWATAVFQMDWKNYDDWHKKYGPEGNLKAYSSWHAVLNFYSGIGILVSKKLIDMDLAQDLISRSLFPYWERYEPVIKGFREQFPRAWRWVEYLYDEMKKREQQLAKI